MEFEIKTNYRGMELWINRKYHGMFYSTTDALRYVWELATGQLDPEVDPQQKLEWD